MTVYLTLPELVTKRRYQQLDRDLAVLLHHFDEGLVFRSFLAGKSERVLAAKRNEARRSELVKFRDGLLVLRDWVLQAGMDPAWFVVVCCALVRGRGEPMQFYIEVEGSGSPEGLVEYLFRECPLVTVIPSE